MRFSADLQPLNSRGYFKGCSFSVLSFPLACGGWIAGTCWLPRQGSPSHRLQSSREAVPLLPTVKKGVWGPGFWKPHVSVSPGVKSSFPLPLCPHPRVPLRYQHRTKDAVTSLTSPKLPVRADWDSGPVNRSTVRLHKPVGSGIRSVGLDLYLAGNMACRDVEAEAGSSSSWASPGQDPNLCCSGKGRPREGHLVHPWPRPVPGDENMHLSQELQASSRKHFRQLASTEVCPRLPARLRCSWRHPGEDSGRS